MKHWKLLLPIPFVAALAMVPQGQDPTDTTLNDVTNVVAISELQYVTAHGPTVVSARNVVEIRFIEDRPDGIRIELYYENGDYSMIDATAFHLLRNGQSTREVKLVRSRTSRMRFPKGI